LYRHNSSLQKNENLIKIGAASQECRIHTPEPTSSSHLPQTPEPASTLPSRLPPIAESPPIIAEDNPFASLCDEGFFVRTSTDSSLAAWDSTSNSETSAIASLDVEDYLHRDAEMMLEAIFLSIHSDSHRDPKIPGYDLSIPPANHNEAMLRPDANE
jgi:hypothetical protein